MYLPKVNPEVGYSISHKFRSTEDKEYFDGAIKLIEEENPVVAKFISMWADLTQEPCDLHSAFCGILVYMLLRYQAEADDMCETINL
jgi:hypothetical protein